MIYELSSPSPFDPDTEWIPIGTLREWVRVDDSQNELLRSLLLAAMAMAEGECKQPLFAREYTVTGSAFTAGTFPGQFISSLAVSYRLSDETDSVVLDASGYTLKGNRLWFAPTTYQLANLSSTTLTVKLGYEPDALPEDIRLALRILVSDFYDNRGNGPRNLPTVVELILRPYKQYSW